jgi:hypothetical protein
MQKQTRDAAGRPAVEPLQGGRPGNGGNDELPF